MNLISQVISTLALVLGIFLGEGLSTKAFGMLKKWWHYLIEIGIFVTIIVLFFSIIEIDIYSDRIIYLISFLVGFFAIIFTRGLISGFGFFSKKIKNKILKERDELDYIIGLKKALERRKFKKEDINKIFKETGFSDKKVKKVEEFFKK